MEALAPRQPASMATTGSSVKKSFSPFGRKYGPSSSSNAAPAYSDTVSIPDIMTNGGDRMLFGASTFSSILDENISQDPYLGPPPSIASPAVDEYDDSNYNNGSAGEPIPYSSMPGSPSVPYTKKSYSPFGSSKPKSSGSGAGGGSYLDSM
jgi:hypothetical protein